MNKFNVTAEPEISPLNMKLDQCLEGWCDDNNVPHEFRAFMRLGEPAHPRTVGDFYKNYLLCFRAGMKVNNQ